MVTEFQHTKTDLERAVWDALATVEDPELPITVTDLGLINEVRIEGRRVHVTMVPTFSACPAIAVIQKDIRERLEALPGIDEASVELSFAEPWTMARMSDRGRQRLFLYGVSVPSRTSDETVECPFCGSTNTTMENPFGPTLCRAIYYCRDCKNPVERFRPPAG